MYNNTNGNNFGQQPEGNSLNESRELELKNIIDFFQEHREAKEAFIFGVAKEMVKEEHEEKAFSIAEDIFNALVEIQSLREDSISDLNDEQKNELKNPDLLVKTLGFLLSFIDEKWLPEYCLELAERYRFYSAYGKINDPDQPQEGRNQRNPNRMSGNNDEEEEGQRGSRRSNQFNPNGNEGEEDQQRSSPMFGGQQQPLAQSYVQFSQHQNNGGPGGLGGGNGGGG